jgi:hypothetical protein
MAPKNVRKAPAKRLKKSKKLEPTKPLTVNTNRYDPYKSYHF